MNLDTLDWSLCRSFLAILREGSLSAAARSLDVAQPTIRRHLETLEQAIGGTLFARSPSGLVPTETAMALQRAAEAMEAAAGLFLRTAASETETVTGTVRITASEIVGVEILPDILQGVTQAHPDLSIELALTNATLDLLRYQADIGVRMARPAQADLIARKAATYELGLFAHQTWLSRHAMPINLATMIQGGRLIGYDRNTSILRGFAERGVDVPRSAFCYRSDNDLAQLAAIRAGLGIGICQVAIARRDASLKRILPDLQADLEVWVAVHPDRRSSRGVRTVFDALVAGLEQFARLD